MIRISSGPIRITKTGEDRWGNTTFYWSVNDWAWVGLEKYQDLIWFESPLQPWLYSSGMAEDVIKRKLELSKGQQVWQFNALKDIRSGTYMRMMACLNYEGDNRLQHVPWFDAYVKHWALNRVCDAVNLVHRIYMKVKGMVK